MSESTMQCPICGKQFPTRLYVIDDNGNPICPSCDSKNQEKEQEGNQKKKDTNCEQA